MFGIREDELTWDVVKNWSYKAYDFDYDLHITCRPMRRQIIGENMLEPVEKPYRLFIKYGVKGEQLLFYTIRANVEANHFESCRLVDLWELSLITTPVVAEVLPPAYEIFSTGTRAAYRGEAFYYAPDTDRLPSRQAFILRYPDDKHYYDWQPAIAFYTRLKERIYSAIQSHSKARQR